MWLLSTDRAELQPFDGPDDKQLKQDGGYAILSHMWQGREKSFQDIQALRSDAHETPPRARLEASAKIRKCCELAESHGFRWVWIDTCCINSESSADLSEAGNSTFEWYLKSSICYAYLDDVNAGTSALEKSFSNSRWFSRGWTLQELIAPRQLLFVSGDWSIIGSKTNLVEYVMKITSIDRDILLHRREIGSTSIYQRMSWAVKRRTAKVEDEAYCLMGIFGVHMPTIYGEGRGAFYRLQEEIMKVSPDQTILCWGPSREITGYEDWDFLQMSSHAASPADNSYLLASSPQDFVSPMYNPAFDERESIPLHDAVKIAERACLNMESDGLLHFDVMATYPDYVARPRNEQRANEFVVTPRGMRATLPILKMSIPLIGGHMFDFHIAILGCGSISAGVVVGLVLHPLPKQSTNVGESTVYISNPAQFRLVTLRASSSDKDRRDATAYGSSVVKSRLSSAKQVSGVPSASITWTTVHVLHRPSMQAITSTSSVIPRAGEPVCFLLSKWSVTELRQWGFYPVGDVLLHPAKHSDLDCSSIDKFGSIRSLDATFRLDAGQGEEFTIHAWMGCQKHGLQVEQSRSSSNFLPLHTPTYSHGLLHSHIVGADVILNYPNSDKKSIPPVNDRDVIGSSDGCSYYIGDERNFTRQFRTEDRVIELTFSLYRQEGEVWNSSSTFVYVYVVDVRLSGSAYQSMRDNICRNLNTSTHNHEQIGSQSPTRVSVRTPIFDVRTCH